MKKLYVLIAILISVLLLMTSGMVGCSAAKPALSTECQPKNGGTISPASGTYENGVIVQISATPATGYRFDHWEGAISGQSPTIQLAMDESKNVIAVFIKTYLLNVSISPTNGGTVTVNPQSDTFDMGQIVTLTASPAPKYQFSGWGGDISGNSSNTTVTMNSNENIVASFTEGAYSLPQMKNLGSSLSGSTLNLSAYLSNDGGTSDIIGFAWGYTQGSYIYPHGSAQVDAAATTGDTVHASISGVSPNTTYYYEWYAFSSGGYPIFYLYGSYTTGNSIG